MYVCMYVCIYCIFRFTFYFVSLLWQLSRCSDITQERDKVTMYDTNV